MLESFFWWLSIQAVGVASLPLALRWLRWLPDRGYFLAKPLGVLLISYALWLGASLGVIDNTRPTVFVLAATIAALCWLLLRQEIGPYLAARWRFVLGIEVAFAAAFALWTLVRAYDPAIAATEKPMEIAFLSATMRSAQFPPVDPWLAGYGISYYYFGYVMVSAVAKLAGVEASVAFNLAIAALFAMTAIGSFTLAYNLAASSRIGKLARGSSAIVCGIFSSLLLVISGNLEPIFELLNARGLLSPAFVRWLAIKDMPAPQVGTSWLPVDSWWWFRATRIIGDFDPVSNISGDYTINEFPFFSFMLGDLHPHLLALPFAVLALSIALNLSLSRSEETALSLRRHPIRWTLLGLVFGGLGFLNSWDLPTYLLVLSLAYGVYRYRLEQDISWRLVRDVFHFGALVLATSIILYLPFYIGFRSQAMGIGFVAVRSKLQHFVLFWGPLFFLFVTWIIMRAKNDLTRFGSNSLSGDGKDNGQQAASRGAHAKRQSILVYVMLLAVCIILVFFDSTVAAFLLALGVIAASFFWLRIRTQQAGDRSIDFVWLLFLTALFLLFICEFVFIRDLFNNRMNTVFKLYFQSWLLMAIAGGYVFFLFASRLQIGRVRRVAWWIMAAIVLAATFVYPVTATWSKNDGFAAEPTLDGQAFQAKFEPADNEAIRWLSANVRGTPVILEATGGSYGPAGRVSAFTGLPTVLGWDFHEQQWRGSYAEQSQRKADVGTIYSTIDRSIAESLLRKYAVTYVYVGPLERELYGKFGTAALGKFRAFAQIVHQNEGVVIYRINGEGSQGGSQSN